MNSTILSLNLYSIFSTSPLFSIQRSYSYPIRSSIKNSIFSRCFSSIIYSNTNRYHTILHNDAFYHIMNSAIFFKSESDIPNDVCYFVYPSKDGGKKYFEKDDLIHDVIVKPDDYSGNSDPRPHFGGISCGDITITKCIFENCHADTNSGGSIFIEQNTSVLIHSTIFKKSYTKQTFGGACAIYTSLDKNNGKDFNTGSLKKLDIQYCCFEECYGGDSSQKVYGSAVFCGAQQAMLYYASTVNCPGTHDEVGGAQFDIDSVNATSHSVNSTGGKSEYCGGIEYRNTKAGFFKFQTISNSTCMFAISYTNVEGTTTNDLDLSYSNIFKITLHRKFENKLYPGLIHVRKTGNWEDSSDFKVKNFCFVDNDYNSYENARIISRGTEGDNFHKIKVILEDCSYDWTDKIAITTENLGADLIVTNNCNRGTKPTTNIVSQLDLGECKGKVTPEPLTPIIPTSNFTESEYFSKSNDFSESKDFNPTDKFSKSSLFTKTDYFSGTDDFSETGPFTKTDYFSGTDYFSKTGPFTKTDYFSGTDYFSKTDLFTKTDYFSGTDDFSKTGPFTKSDYFSGTDDLSRIGTFTKTDHFSRTDYFTKTDHFTRTDDFTKTGLFTKTDHFSRTDYFSKTSLFTKTDPFSESCSFSDSKEFTESNVFVPPVQPGDLGEDGKKNTAMIAGVVVGAVAAIAIIVALVAFFLWKKKHLNIDEDSADLVDGQETVISVDNNLNTVMEEDDPFAADFNN